MSELFEQKYSNPIRTITGTVTPYQSDVVLNCDTSSGAVIINLLEIPADHWSTTTKLYIVDSGGNAATNNITVNAPAGFFINGLPTLIINQNGAGAIVRVGNNLNYIAQLTYGEAPITDTGWLDLNGFTWITGGAVKPQYRVIGKQIHFRNDLIIPLDNGSGAVVNFAPAASPQGNTYVSQIRKTPYTGTGGGVTLNSAGQITFNNGNPVLQSSDHYPDQAYVSQWLVASRRVNSDIPQQYIPFYTTVFRLILSTAGVMTLITLKDFEQAAALQQIGESNLRYLVSQAIANNVILDYRNFTDVTVGNPATLIGAQNDPMTPAIGFNSQTARHTLTFDAAEETDVGGFATPLNSFIAFLR